MALTLAQNIKNQILVNLEALVSTGVIITHIFSA